MASLPQHRAAAQLTTAIARMLGKAVKLRHCPATVSAPAHGSRRIEVIGEGRISAWVIPPVAERPSSHWSRTAVALGFGKAAEAGASQETGPWRFHPLSRSEGNEGAIMPTPSFLRSACARVLKHSVRFAVRALAAFFLVFSAAVCFRRVHPRCGDRRHRRQGHRRQRVSLSATVKSSPRPSPRPTAVSRSLTGADAAAFSWWSRPRVFANCRRPTSTPASSTPSSATSCLSRTGCASRSW